MIKRIFALAMALSLMMLTVSSLASCDVVFEVVEDVKGGIDNIRESIDDLMYKPAGEKTSAAYDLYFGAHTKLNKCSTEAENVFVSVEWRGNSSPDLTNKVVISNTNAAFYIAAYEIAESEGQESKSAELSYIDGNVYYKDVGGNKLSYTATLADAKSFANKNINPLRSMYLPMNGMLFPASWFKNSTITDMDDGTKMVDFELDQNSEKRILSSSDVNGTIYAIVDIFHTNNTKCKMYFTNDGNFSRIEYENVNVNGNESSLIVLFDFTDIAEICAPEDNEDYVFSGDLMGNYNDKPDDTEKPKNSEESK